LEPKTYSVIFIVSTEKRIFFIFWSKICCWLC